jgi:hypothetical protein
MPRTIARATSSADRGVIAAESTAVSRGLCSFSAASPGVSVSGGYAHATTIPCGASSGRSVSARPRTAYFAGAYALYPNTPMSAAVDATITTWPWPRTTIDGTVARTTCSVPK